MGRSKKEKEFTKIHEIFPENDNDDKKNKGSDSELKKQIKIPPYAWKVLVILSCIATMVMYAETMLIPAIPTLINDFDVSYGLSSWLLTSYLIAGAVMTPIAGKLSDTYGRKKILLIIMGIYAFGVSIGGFASDIYTLVIARAIQGIGMSMFPIAFSIVRDQFPREKISIAQGAITSMFAAGSVIGLSIGAVIIQHFGWRMTFFTIIPISILILLVIRKYIHIDDNYNYEIEIQKKLKIGAENNNQSIKHSNEEKLKEGKKPGIQIDVKGSVLLAFTITSFLLALTFMQNADNGSNLPLDTKGFSNSNSAFETILPFLITGIVSLVLFMYVEKRAKFPLIDFKIFLKPPILLSSTIIMIVGMSMFMVFQTIPILVQSPEPIGFGDDAVETGKIQLPFAIMLLIFGPTSGIIISKLGSLKPIIFGSILTTCGFTVLYLFHSSELLISSSLGILSAGLSLSAVGAMNIIILASPRESAGVTIGMSSMLRIVGSSVGPALAAMYMQTNQSVISVDGLTESLPSSFSFDLIFLTAIILSVASITVAIVLSKKTGGKEIWIDA
ncbi:MAG: MFS transporter [Nitrosopumilus sp.]|nr:MFS transporter [Nitrosopumilus sp.]